ncbi:hypothetical protein HDZ31DRAFT_61322 [Schizophyllum fasciatum]
MNIQRASAHVDEFLAQASHMIARHRMLASAALPATLLALLIPSMIRDYHAYLDLGEGGVPHNPIGWLIARFLGLFARETQSIAVYDTHSEQRAWLSAPLPLRAGPRPTTGRQVVPHRQVNQFPPEPLKPRIRALMQVLHTRYPNTTLVAPSLKEGHSEALFVHPDVPCPVADRAISQRRGREIAHTHPLIDCSFHALLSPRDCKEVIAKGWGERHPLSGTLGEKEVQINFLFVYAPRSEEELGVVTRILEAGIGYMLDDDSLTGSKAIWTHSF